MTAPHLTTEELRFAVSQLPRLRLAHLPTPLEAAPRLSKHLAGPRIHIKRDDCTGVLFGGNKTRHNEFLLAEALRQEADVLVWSGGVQSNNARQTAAACNKLGLDCELILSRAAHAADLQGNLLLDHLMGARVTVVDDPLGPGLDDLVLARAQELRAQGRRPFVWNRVTGRPLATVGYLLAAAELLEDTQRLGLRPTHVYCCAAGATGAGLALAKVVLGLPWRVRLICPIQWPYDTPADLAEVANQTAALLGLPHRLTAADVDITNDYIGTGYGKVTAEGLEALRLTARLEGILLDPAYTSKAMAALIDDVRLGRLTRDDEAIFLHTGGAPAVFAFRDELVQR